VTVITRLPLAALITAALFWGTAVSVTKYALRGFGPITLLAISLIAGTAVLWTIVILPAMRFRSGERPDQIAWGARGSNPEPTD
jgi:hypothetical protein